MNFILDDLAEYRARVEAARLSGSRDTIHNSSDRHAAVLIEQLFLAAENNVRILCRQLNIGVYGSAPVLAAASLFIRREGVRMQIIVQDSAVLDFEKHPFLKEFGALPNVEIRTLDEAVDPGIDFFVADGNAYRFEPDPTSTVARASFNRPAMASVLVKIFNEARSPARMVEA
jgi:hypothetical protein